MDGGEVGPGHSLTALYAVRLADRVAGDDRVARVDVRWLDPRTRKASETTARVNVSDVDADFAESNARFRVCYAAAYLAEVLRHSPYAANVRLADLSAVADDAAARTEDPAVRDLARVIAQAAELV